MDDAATWIEARARIARMGDAAPWTIPPLIPVADVDDIVLDRQGRFAIILGYAGAHRLDLSSLRSTRVFSDNRTERRAGLSADSRTLFIFDDYGPTLHRVDLRTRTVESIHGKRSALRNRFKSNTQRRSKKATGLRLIKGRPHVVIDDLPVPLLPPVGQFKRVRAVARTPGGLIAVVGTCLSAPGASEIGLYLTLFAPDGTLLGLIGLAQRGQDATHVYIGGQRADVEALAAKGIHISTDRSMAEQAAVDRFAPSAHDGTTEVVFGRAAGGFFGRLDVDTALGDRAFGLEDPERARLGLQGLPLPADERTDCGLDAMLRWQFWQRLNSPKTRNTAFTATAGLTDLLPEIDHRSDGARTQKERRQQIQRAAHALRSLDATQRKAAFDAMLERVRLGMALTRLAAILDHKPASLHAGLRDTALSDVENITAACLGAPTLNVGSGLMLIERAASELGHLETLELRGVPDAQRLLKILLRQSWPHLRHLKAPQLRLTDAQGMRLAAAPVLPALTELHISPQSGALGQAALHFSDQTPVQLSGDHDAHRPALLTHPKLAARLRETILCAKTPQTGMGICVDAAQVPGVDLAAVLKLLNAQYTPVFTVLNALITPHLLAALGARKVHCIRCDFSPDTIDVLITRSWVKSWTFEQCTFTPTSAVMLTARLGKDGPELADPPADLHAFLTDDSIDDRLWYRTLERLEARPDIELTEAAAALNLNAWRALVVRRPGLGRLAAHPLAFHAIFELMRAQVADGAHLLAPYGPFELNTTADGWSIATLAAPAFDMANEPTFVRMRQLFGGQDVQTGDRAFDDIARLAGEPRTILAALNAPARAACALLLESDIVLRQGVLHGTGPLPATLETALRALVQWVHLKVDIATLTQRFFTEPEAGVRARLLDLLLSDAKLLDADRDAILKHAARDRSSAIRERVTHALAAQKPPPDTLDPLLLAAFLPRLSGQQQLEAIARLGEEGDEHCVAALTAVGTGLFVGRVLKDASRAAIAAIAERSGGLRTGGLSVSKSGPGDLALTSDAE